MANEKRLIDANALEYTRVRIFHGMNEDGTLCVGGWNAVVMSCAIKDAPTVDAVPVVRCKDCKYAEKDEIHQVSLRCTRFRTGEFTHRMQPDDFCSYGERREGE